MNLSFLRHPLRCIAISCIVVLHASTQVSWAGDDPKLQKPKTKLTYIENEDGSMTAISEVITEEPVEQKGDGSAQVKSSINRLVEVTPGAKRALEMSKDQNLPALSAADFEAWIEKAGGSLDADPQLVNQALHALAEEGIEVRLSDVRRLVRQSGDKRVTNEIIKSWLSQTVPSEAPAVTHGRSTPDCPGLVYGSGKREICLPLGAVSFADEAVAFVPGEKPSQAPFNKPVRALGEPNYRNTDLADFMSIGCNGELTLKFVDNVLIDVDGVDLYIFEVGPFVEKMQLAISADGIHWLDIGAIEGARSDVDIAPFVKKGDKFSFVKLTNAGKSCGGRHSGADIDAVAAVGAELRLSLDSALLFDVGQSELKPEALAAIDELAVRISELGTHIHITVEGHTDSTGSDNNNQKLSEARANSVWQYLSKKLPGVKTPPHIMGYGESRPIASNDTEEERAKNRRVDVLIRPNQRVK